MRKRGIINGKLMGVLAGLGHTDSIVISDAGLPIPKECDFIDLALINGIPSFIDTVEAIINEIIVEKVSIFKPMQQANPSTYEQLTKIFVPQQKELLDAEQFIDEVKKAKLVIRTAEFSPCCNIILYSASGVKEMCESLDIRR